MLALAAGHPEWEDELLKQVESHKSHVQNPQQLLKRIREDYAASESTPEKLPESPDTATWNERVPEIQARIKHLLTYFRPKQDEIARHLLIIPSDRLLRSKHSGQSFTVGDTVLVQSHTKNPSGLDNIEHEFLHSIINPITERLATDIDGEKIVALARRSLKEEEQYGDHPLSLLNEELIRTYNELVEKGKSPSIFLVVLKEMNCEKKSFNCTKSLTQKKQLTQKLGLVIFSPKKSAVCSANYTTLSTNNCLQID